MSASLFSRVRIVVLGVALGGLIVGFWVALSAQQVSRPEGFISGVVEGPKGPEAGVWVIAETTDLPTKFIKIVVTADDGRFVLPELPKATYSVWVRGYGLVDSTPIKAAPGDTLTLKATAAKTPQEAAKIYPANYWYSLLQVPAKSEFPGTGTGPGGNGISPNIKTQGEWVTRIMNGCQSHHQLGGQITRQTSHMPTFDSTVAAWEHRLQVGQRGNMIGIANQLGRDRALKMFADWTDRIAAGEVPPAPPRPRGRERTLVLSMWDWAAEDAFLHDLWSTDKRNPRVNAGGPVYAVSSGHGRVVVADIVVNRSFEVKIPTREDPATIPTRFPQDIKYPSFWYGKALHWGDIADKRGEAHNLVMDGQRRVWLTSRVRGEKQPAWCTDGSVNKYARYFPLKEGEPRQPRQASYYDPKTGKFTLIDTCFGTHHLNFGEDAQDTLWFSGDNSVIGWVDTKKYDETGDEQASQGWCPVVFDTNGDGKITKPWNEPGQPVDPRRDTRAPSSGMYYGINADPTEPDGSVVWAGRSDPFPGAIYRFDRGSNPPETCIAEIYEAPSRDVNPKVDPAKSGHTPRGGPDLARDGLVWVSFASSGHMASFDRRKCAVRNGPQATGQHCVEGWTLYENPGPKFKGVTDPGSADFHYFNWVDQFNTAGLGANVPFSIGTGSDSLQALLPTGERIILRVPYPLGFYSRGMDGRIDDPNAGWKGRGLWAAFGTTVMWQLEGGKGTRSKAVHFQLRPDPLAR